MGYQLKINPDEHLVVVIFYGRVSIEELLKLDDEIPSHPDFLLSFKGVYDFRDSVKGYTPQDLKKLKNKSDEFNPSKGRWCSLNSTPIETGLSELFKIQRKKVHPIESFCTIEAASHFLGIDLSQYLKHH